MLKTGTLLDGRYETSGRLGTGGMGHVYRAMRPLLGDEVAVKVMRASFDAPGDGSGDARPVTRGTLNDYPSSPGPDPDSMIFVHISPETSGDVLKRILASGGVH